MLDFESFGIATVMKRFASLRLEPEMLPTSILFNHRDTENTEENQEHECIRGVKHGAGKHKNSTRKLARFYNSPFVR